MTRLSSRWTAAYKVLLFVQAAGICFLAGVFAKQQQFIPFVFGLGAAGWIVLMWQKVFRFARDVFATDRGLMVKDGERVFEIPFARLKRLEKLEGWRGPFFQLFFEAEGGHEERLVIIAEIGPFGFGGGPHRLERFLIEKAPNLKSEWRDPDTVKETTDGPR